MIAKGKREVEKVTRKIMDGSHAKQYPTTNVVRGKAMFFSGVCLSFHRGGGIHWDR